MKILRLTHGYSPIRKNIYMWIYIIVILFRRKKNSAVLSSNRMSSNWNVIVNENYNVQLYKNHYKKIHIMLY